MNLYKIFFFYILPQNRKVLPYHINGIMDYCTKLNTNIQEKGITCNTLKLARPVDTVLKKIFNAKQFYATRQFYV